MTESYLYRSSQPDIVILVLTLLNLFNKLLWNGTLEYLNNPDIIEHVKSYRSSIYNGHFEMK